MVKIKAGERKKQLIISTCKELFYNNGFTNTTYEMICSKADIAPGSITYHFSSKLDIAAMIGVENDEMLRQYVSTIAKESEIGHWAFTVMMIWSRWYCFLHDANMRRFYSEIFGEDLHLDNTVAVFKMHQQYCDLDKTDNEMALIAATFIGQDSIILKMLERDPLRYSLEQIAEYVIINLFKVIDLNQEEAEYAKRKGTELFCEFQKQFDLGFFKEFRYQH